VVGVSTSKAEAEEGWTAKGVNANFFVKSGAPRALLILEGGVDRGVGVGVESAGGVEGKGDGESTAEGKGEEGIGDRRTELGT
jgi:hypothetical protein